MFGQFPVAFQPVMQDVIIANFCEIIACRNLSQFFDVTAQINIKVTVILGVKRRANNEYTGRYQK